jgi:hypothetical protein
MRDPNTYARATRKLRAGDLVRLTSNEPGPYCTAYAGEWGEVVRVHLNGNLDVQLAGFCRPRTHPASRVLDLPQRVIEPCDKQGRPKPLPTVRHWAGLDQ